MIKGNRVQLRPLRKADSAFITKWFNDPEVSILSNGGCLPQTEMLVEKWIEESATTRAMTDTSFIIEAVEGNETKAIGLIDLDGIQPKDHNAGFAITIGNKEYWNRGYGTEATRLILKYGFAQLNLHRISSNAFSFNERSIRMHKKLGFREEGRQREINFSNGQYHDLVLFGILKKEWQEDVER
jgi:RimJ/RimL family protein N-acetyltransferase